MVWWKEFMNLKETIYCIRVSQIKIDNEEKLEIAFRWYATFSAALQ